MRTILALLGAALLFDPSFPDLRFLDGRAGGPEAWTAVSLRDGRVLEVTVRSGGEERVVEYEPALAGGRIVEARLAEPGASAALDVFLGLVVQREGGHDYRFALLRGTPDGETTWVLSDPIFESEGSPFHIVEVHRSHRITFRRGSLGLRSDLSGVEERLFFDTCPEVPSLFSGKARLVDLRSGETLPFPAPR